MLVLSDKKYSKELIFFHLKTPYTSFSKKGSCKELRQSRMKIMHTVINDNNSVLFKSKGLK
ncbi:MAG: hypothetical protein A2096_15025 [Spirochaetes bacterium GWF1_41_5]|nr:MAG: hypothetical protein A2096_15025 [Spirochaetes bacterium GWF1_41_5]